MRPDCSSGLQSRNSCGEKYISKVGLNVFHCWKICHYGHFSPPDSWPAMPPKLPSHTAHFMFSDQACLFLCSHATSVPGLHIEEPGSGLPLSTLGTSDWVMDSILTQVKLGW